MNTLPLGAGLSSAPTQKQTSNASPLFGRQPDDPVLSPIQKQLDQSGVKVVDLLMDFPMNKPMIVLVVDNAEEKAKADKALRAMPQVETKEVPTPDGTQEQLQYNGTRLEIVSMEDDNNGPLF